MLHARFALHPTAIARLRFLSFHSVSVYASTYHICGTSNLPLYRLFGSDVTVTFDCTCSSVRSALVLFVYIRPPEICMTICLLFCTLFCTFTPTPSLYLGLATSFEMELSLALRLVPSIQDGSARAVHSAHLHDLRCSHQMPFSNDPGHMAAQ